MNTQKNELKNKIEELNRMKKEVKNLQKAIDSEAGFRFEPAKKFIWEKGTDAYCCLYQYQSYPNYLYYISEEDKEKSRRWYRLVDGRTREECIENIKEFIDKLTIFYNNVKAEIEQDG